MACEDAPQPGEACGGACDLGTYCTAEKACGKEKVVADCKDGAIAWQVLSCG